MFEVQKKNPSESDEWHFNRITGFDGGARNLKIAVECRLQPAFPSMSTLEGRFETMRTGRGSFWDFDGLTTHSATALFRWASEEVAGFPPGWVTMCVFF